MSENKESSKHLAIQNCTKEQSVTSLDPSTNASIFDLDEKVKSRYEGTDAYRSLKNAELDYALRLAKTECTRCTRNRPGEVICCEENCTMFKAKSLAYDEGFSNYSPCYNCPRYENECLGINSPSAVCKKEETIPLAAMEGVIDDDIYKLLEEAEFEQVPMSLFKTIKSTMEYFKNQSRYTRTDLIYASYVLNAVTNLLLTYSQPQKVVGEITKTPVGYKIEYGDSTVYASDDIVMVKGDLERRKVLELLEQIEDKSYNVNYDIKWAISPE